MCIRDRLNTFLRLYSSSISLPFTCFGHPKYLDYEIVQWLKDAGCKMIWIGIQSGNEWVRKKILNRHETNEEIISACRLIKEAGIKLMIDHIFGIPFDVFPQASYNFYK